MGREARHSLFQQPCRPADSRINQPPVKGDDHRVGMRFVNRETGGLEFGADAGHGQQVELSESRMMPLQIVDGVIG